jgi:hypothetical protein
MSLLRDSEHRKPQPSSTFNKICRLKQRTSLSHSIPSNDTDKSASYYFSEYIRDASLRYPLCELLYGVVCYLTSYSYIQRSAHNG